MTDVTASPPRIEATIAPASSPWVRTSWWTLVRSASRAMGWSSMPITDMSCGTRTPARRSVRSAPIAISSECASTAVGGCRRLSRRSMAMAPSSAPQGTRRNSSSSTGMPDSASAVVYARARPSMGHSPWFGSIASIIAMRRCPRNSRWSTACLPAAWSSMLTKG
jgi:hypothetical protein